MYNIILPTYNERENIAVLLKMITNCMKEMNYKYKIVVVDDGSPDNTYKFILRCKLPNLIPIYRKDKNGLASAYKEAIKQCSYPFTFIMDADLSHDPSYLKEMIKIQKRGDVDIVSSTRYALNGGIFGWSLKRKITSRFANDLASLLLDLKTSDCTGSFRLYKTNVLNELLEKSVSNGYSIQMELIYMAERKGYKIKECPIIFYEREKGASKLSFLEIVNFLRKKNLQCKSRNFFFYPWMFVSSDNNTVVVDVGSETFKIGYSNRDVPLMFNSTYTTKNSFKSPVNCSVIEDYQSYFTIISDNIPSDTCYLLIAENTFENDEHRAKLLSDLMENNMCDSLFFGKSAILDAFSYGKTNALVIVLSGGTTQAVAVLDGFIVSRKKIDYGCSNISRKFQEKLEKNIDFSEKIKLSKDIKNYESFFEFKKFEFSRFSKEEFYLKWKKSYEKKNTINYSSCDFNIEQQFLSIHSKIFDVVDLVKEIVSNLTEEKKYLLLNNIVISGGGSLIPFISEVLEKMLSEKLKTSKVRIANNSSRFHTFFGGCILSNIGLVKTLQIGKLDYKEYGSSILDRKKFNWII